MFLFERLQKVMNARHLVFHIGGRHCQTSSSSPASSSFLALVLLSFSIGPVSHCLGSRPKRIVGGHYLPDRDPSLVPYGNVRYFAYIENGHSCDRSPSWWERWGKWIISGWCAPRKDTLKCGGALITPKIIQTACHCTAYFQIVEDLGKTYRWAPAVGKNAWQEGISVYLGLNDITQFKSKVHVWSMWPHPKCAVLQSTQYLTHDFGWLHLEFPVQEDFLNYQGYFIDYAPLYKMDTLERLYSEAFAKEQVCLIIGFGKEEEKSRVGSEVLKHTWMQLLPSELCFWLTASWKKAVADVGSLVDPETYTNYSSWVCGAPFNEFFEDGFNSGGDSGSPIACNNNYFAVVSGHFLPDSPRAGVKILMRQHAIKYAPKENAAEYRSEFIRLVDDEDWKYKIDDDLRSLMHRKAKNQLYVSMQRPFASKIPQLKDKSSLSVSTNLISGYPPSRSVNQVWGLLFPFVVIFFSIIFGS